MAKANKKIKRTKKLKERSRQKKVLSNKIESIRKALVAKIVKWDDPILKTPAKEVEDLQSNLQVVNDLKEVIDATTDGVGIAANQIGSLNSVFITRPDFPEKKTVNVFINPEITKYGEEKTTAQEGCLSYPGHYCDVERSEKIIINYTDENGHRQTQEFTGWHARIISHEYDHLQGVCAIGNDFYKN